ncbi:hypothetical protein [Burkholderia oklahomensis]|uniref:Uncharacterized protein n=1 Tax=Burkholderia oklahomensis TaxID=342113 RepID=A0AAI8FS92_9BURK|nr:hypothetical protein [Burkholderia oklahomensis]AIO70752.1 hypothetical protein DM82_5979 [Burkholderia oklahomensis]QPS40951.1 hypothetical protein I6G57_22050 [Burkholderia oklahomensis]
MGRRDERHRAWSPPHRISIRIAGIARKQSARKIRTMAARRLSCAGEAGRARNRPDKERCPIGGACSAGEAKESARQREPTATNPFVARAFNGAHRYEDCLEPRAPDSMSVFHVPSESGSSASQKVMRDAARSIGIASRPGLLLLVVGESLCRSLDWSVIRRVAMLRHSNDRGNGPSRPATKHRRREIAHDLVTCRSEAPGIVSKTKRHRIQKENTKARSAGKKGTAR